MGRNWKLWLLTPLMLLTACGKPDFDPAAVAAHYADGSLIAQYTVTTHGDFYTEYQLSATVEDGVHTVTIVRPESVAGVTAVLQNSQTTIRYEDVSLDALLPQIDGYAPMDVLHGLLADLRQDLPVSWTMETDTVTLDYQETLSDGTELWKRAVLQADTLTLQSAEIYLDGDLLLALQTDRFQWTAAG